MNILETLVSNEYLRFLIILIGTIIVVTISYFILKYLVKRVAGRNKKYGFYLKEACSNNIIYILI